MARDYAPRNSGVGAVSDTTDASEYAGQLLVAAGLQCNLRQSRHCERHPYRSDLPRC